MKPVIKLSRRDFVKTTGLLVLGVSMSGCGRGDNPVHTSAGSETASSWSPDVFVSIDADGAVYIVSHRSENGPGDSHQPDLHRCG